MLSYYIDSFFCEIENVFIFVIDVLLQSNIKLFFCQNEVFEITYSSFIVL